MKRTINSTDPDIIGGLAALERAARRARKLSIATKTPFIVMRDGRMVDLNAGRKRRRTKR